MYKIKTTKQAFDLINKDGQFDEPFIVHEAHAYDQSFNIAGLISIIDNTTANALLKGGSDVDYKQLAKTVVDSDLYQRYKALDLSHKNIIESGVVNDQEFDLDRFDDFARRKDAVNRQVVIDSTENMQTIIDSGILTKTELDNEWKYLMMPGFIKGVDFNKVTEPGTTVTADIYIDYATLFDCKVPKEVQIAWSNIVSCDLADGSKISQNHISAMRKDKPTVIGKNAQILNCSADNVTIGANSLIFSMQRNPIVDSDIGNSCHLVGGFYQSNKYGDNIKADVPTADVLANVFGSAHMATRKNERGYWKMSPLTSPDDLEGATTIIFPKELNSIDHMIQYTDSANREIKRGVIGGSVSVGIRGKGVPGPYHGVGPLIRAEYRQQYLDSQDTNLTNILGVNRDKLVAHVESVFKRYFGTESKVDMFDDTGGDPVYKNTELVGNVVDRITGGFKDTLLKSRSHKDLSNDHEFATSVVQMVREEVAASYKLNPDELTLRGHQFKFNMEKSKQLLRDIVAVLPELQEFNLVRGAQAAEIARIEDDCMDTIGHEVTAEQIQDELSGAYDEDGVRIISESDIIQLETANADTQQMGLFDVIASQKQDQAADESHDNDYDTSHSMRF